MNTVLGLRTECEDLDVEYEVLPVVDVNNTSTERQKRIVAGIASIDERLSEIDLSLA